MVVTARFIWIFAVGYLSIGPIMAPLPLLGCLGGLLKLVGYMNGGVLFVLHMTLLAAYAGLYSLHWASREYFKTPVFISATAVTAIVLPVVLCLLTCSPEWVVPGQVSQQASLLRLPSAILQPHGFSFAEWMSTQQPCMDVRLLENVTTIYRTCPLVGPGSREDTFFNPITRIVFSYLGDGDGTKTSLKVSYYPCPEQEGKALGLVIFIHGGGWWGGTPEFTPSGCHASFAHSQKWAYATVEYRLGRAGWSGDAQIDDVKAGIRHLIEQHAENADTSKVVLIGSSAGAHLALLAGYQLNHEKASLEEPVVAGVVAVAPSTSVAIGTGEHSIPPWRGSWSEAKATQRFCEGVSDCDGQLSPLEHVTQYAPKTILLHGTMDEYYTPLHSRALAQKLADHNVSYVHIEPPLMPHCIDLATKTIPYQMAKHATIELMQSLQR